MVIFLIYHQDQQLLDFAYAIHSQVGNRCVSAKVNGLIFPLRHKLENGDQVEIINEDNAKPSPNWLGFAVTSKAKNAIKNSIRNQKFDEYSNLGKAILTKFFTARNLEISDAILEKILNKFSKKTIPSLYYAVAEGSIQREAILRATYPEFETQVQGIQIVQTSARLQSSLPIGGVIAGMSVSYASCCNPILGDKIIGIINTGNGVAIHNQQCRIAQNSILTPSRSLDVWWRDDEKNLAQSYIGKIRIYFESKKGALASITSIIARNQVNISTIKTSNRSNNMIEIIIDVEVRDLDNLEEVISALRISEKIIEVERVF